MPSITVGRTTTPAEGILGILGGVGEGLAKIQQDREAKNLQALQLLAKSPNVQLSPLGAGEVAPTSFLTRLLTGQSYEPGPSGAPVINVGGVPVSIKPAPQLDIAGLFGVNTGETSSLPQPGAGIGAVTPAPIQESGLFSTETPRADSAAIGPVPTTPGQTTPQRNTGVSTPDEPSATMLDRLATSLRQAAPAPLRAPQPDARLDIPALRPTNAELLAEPGIAYAVKLLQQNPGDTALKHQVATLMGAAANNIVTRKQKQYELAHAQSKDLIALKADALKALQDAGQFQGSASLRQQIIDAQDPGDLLPALGQASEAVANNRTSKEQFDRVKSSVELHTQEARLQLERQRTLGNEPDAATKAVLASKFALPYWSLATPEQLTEAKTLADQLKTNQAAQQEAATQAERPLPAEQQRSFAGLRQSLNELNDIYTLYRQTKESGKSYVGNFVGPAQKAYRFTGKADEDSVVLQNMLSALALNITRAQTGLVSTDTERAAIAQQLPSLNAGDASFLPNLQALGRRLSQTLDTDISVAQTPRKALDSLRPSTLFDTKLPGSKAPEQPQPEQALPRQGATPIRPPAVQKGQPGRSPQGQVTAVDEQLIQRYKTELAAGDAATLDARYQQAYQAATPAQQLALNFAYTELRKQAPPGIDARSGSQRVPLPTPPAATNQAAPPSREDDIRQLLLEGHSLGSLKQLGVITENEYQRFGGGGR